MSVKLAVVLLAAVAAWAQEAAPVVVDGRVLWTVKVPRAGFGPSERAEDVRASLIHVAEDPRRRLDDLREVHVDSETILLVSRVYLFSVTESDAAAEKKSREALFAERKRIAIDSIQRYREVRSWRWLAQSVALAFGGLLLGVLGLVLLRLLFRRASAGLVSALDRVSHAAAVGPVYKALEGPIALLIRTSVRLVFVGLTLIVLFVTFSFVLGLFPSTAGLSHGALSKALEVVAAVGGALVAYLPNLLVLVLIGLFTRALLGLTRALARAVEAGTVTLPGFHQEWAAPTYDLVRILLILFALVVAFPYLPGGESPALKGASIFIGVLVSLGSGSAMGNVISGVILTYMRPFRNGDRVRIADTVGDVIEKSLLVTRIRTIKNVEIIVPNSAILGAHIVNYSANAADHGVILHATVTIGYDAPWRTVHELLISAALKTESVLGDPRPFVFQTSLNDYHVSYEINVFTREANRMATILSDLNRNIQEEFNAGGIEIMSPGYFAVRDGNTVTIPADHRPAGYVPPSFRVKAEGE